MTMRGRTTTGPSAFAAIPAGRSLRAAGGHDYLEGIGVDRIAGLKQEQYQESLYDAGGFSPYIRNTTIEVNIPEGAETSRARSA